MIDLHQMRVFCQVAERKSFSAAAEALLLTQPTVSSHIKNIEEELGAPLFDRLARRVELTEAGKMFYRHAREMLDLHARVMERFRDLSGDVSGVLDVGGSTIPGEYLLPGIIGAFRETAPAVELNLHIADSEEITSLILERKLELGVVGAKPSSGALESRPFCRDHLVLIVSPAHELARRHTRSITWKKLLGEGLWLREAGSGTGSAFLSALSRRGKGLRDINVLGRLGTTEAVKQAVRKGRGAGVVSSLAVRDETEGRRLRALTIEGLDLERLFHIIRLKGHHLSPAGRGFLDYLIGAGREMKP